MEGLEDDADGAAAEPRQRVLVENGQVLAGDLDRARFRPLEPGNRHEQRRLAAARRPDQAQRLARLDGEVDASEDMDGGGAACRGGHAGPCRL